MYRPFTTLKTQEEKDVEELETMVEKDMVGRRNKFFEFIKELIGVKKTEGVIGWVGL